MKVLVIAAHPDDELLGVGGTVARHAESGDDVTLAVVCEGITMRYDPERHTIVEQQVRRAASVLGARDVHVGNLPDQKLDTIPLSDVVEEVENLLERAKPRVVYTHFGGDVNRDHQVLAEAVLVAARPYAAPWVEEILMFETPSSTEWGASAVLPRFDPTVFVDIESTLERKIEAFLCYDAEVRPEPHPRSAAALRDRARYWGSLVNRRAAEPFQAVRMLR